MEDWAEIRRLYRAENLSISEIARRLGVARNTVSSAVASERPPRYERKPAGSLVDAVEPQIRVLLSEFPRMPATVIAERIGWRHSSSILRARIHDIRPEYVGVDPVDRTVYQPGGITQCDLWFPEAAIPVGHNQIRTLLPVLVMTVAYSRLLSAVMLPSRQSGDLLAGMWQILTILGRVTKTLVWDRESAIGGRGKLTIAAASFAGSLSTRITLAPPNDPEFKGLVERNNRYLETSFLPGREFASPQDFNAQLGAWLPTANSRQVRAIHSSPVETFPADYQAMTDLPTQPPAVGITSRIRLPRDYYVRIDTVDYSVDPRVIGRFVDVTATPETVIVRCNGVVVAEHQRCWAQRVTVTDPVHADIAKSLRSAFAADRAHRAQSTRRHSDGHPVVLRSLPDYDALFGVDFTSNDPTVEASNQ